MKKQNTGKLRIIPLGGLEQIGMNITAFEYEDSIIVVDCGHRSILEQLLAWDGVPHVQGLVSLPWIAWALWLLCKLLGVNTVDCTRGEWNLPVLVILMKTRRGQNEDSRNG